MKEQPDTSTLQGKIAVMQAYADGKRIEWNWKSDRHNNYAITTKPLWNWDEVNYRIHPHDLNPKPEKKWRPWKPEEVPVGAIARPLADTTSCYLIGAVNIGGIGLGFLNAESSEFVFTNYEHSLDGGKTWNKCGVLE